MMMHTLAGNYSTLGTASLRGMRLPAFDKNRVISEHEFQVFDTDCRYDIILGGDFLKKIGINLKQETLEMEWCGNTIPMETLERPEVIATHVHAYLASMEEDDFDLE